RNPGTLSEQCGRRSLIAAPVCYLCGCVRRGRCRRRVPGQSCACQGGLGVVQLLEDGQRLLPGVPGGALTAGDLLGVGEVGEDLCLQERIPGVPGQGQGTPVALAGLIMTAEMVLSEPDAVPGPCLAFVIAGLMQRL